MKPKPHKTTPYLSAWYLPGTDGHVATSADRYNDNRGWIVDYWDGYNFVIVADYGDDREAAERHAEALYLAGVWYDGDKDEPTGAT